MKDLQTTRSVRTGFWMLIALLALFAATKAVVYDTMDPDCFWHMRVAGQLHRDGIGPLVDDLSFSSIRQPWTPYSWLAELGMKWVWDHGGFRAAVACTAGVEAVLIILLAGCCLEAQQSCAKPRYLLAAVCTAVGVYLIEPYLSFRPVTFGFLLLFTCAWLVLRDLRQPSARIWFAVPLTVLFTNVHLFSFFVPAMLLTMGLGAAMQNDTQATRRYALLASATALGCLATPMLPGLLRTIFFYSAQDKMVQGPVIAEMQPFARGWVGWLLAMMLVSALILIIVNRRLVPVGLLICVAITTLLLLKLGRFAPIFALAICPVLAAVLPTLKDRILGRPALISLLGCILLMGFCRLVTAFPDRSTLLSAWVNRHGPESPGYPCLAADFVEQSLPGSARRFHHLINEFSWGGYLEYRLNGKFQTLLDGRTQVYPASLWQATYLGDDEQRRQFLAGVNADVALLPVNKSVFYNTLIGLGWKKVYADDRAQVLIPPEVHLAGVE